MQVKLKQSIPWMVLLIAVLMVLPHFVTASNPSPNNWNFDGGGFCTATYKIFNSTDNKLYAENCITGTNDCAAYTDLGNMMTSCVFPLEPNGGYNYLTCQLFAISTSIVLGRSGIQLQGCGYGGNQNSMDGHLTPSNGTLLMAKANSLVMIEATAGSPGVTCPTTINTKCVWSDSSSCPSGLYLCVFSTVLNNFGMNNGGFTSVVAINMAMAETAPHTLVENIRFEGNLGTQWAAPMLIMDGAEDSFLDNLWCNCAVHTPEVRWMAENGNVNVFQSTLTSMQIGAQIATITQSTFSNILVGGDMYELHLIGDYLGNAQVGITSRINLNGHTIRSFLLDGEYYLLSATISFYSGAGTVINFGASSSTWVFSGSTAWNPGGATLTKQTSTGTNNVVSGSNPSNFPFAPDGNGNF
jgi:hypothetical protein